MIFLKKTIGELKILCQVKNINFTPKTSKTELIKLLVFDTKV